MAYNKEKEIKNRKKLGKMIKVLRDHKGVTQEEMAEALDISCPYVSGIETGKKSPSMSVFIDLIQFLETDPNTILKGIYNPIERQDIKAALILEIEELNHAQMQSLLQMLKVMKGK